MKRILFVLLALTMVLGLCACATTEESKAPSDADESKAVSQEESKESSADESVASLPEFIVNVVDADGNAVEGAMIQICKDACIPARTGADGKAVFNITVTDGYKLSVLSCPEGYEYTGDAEVYLESGSTEYTVELTKVTVNE